MTPSLRRSLTKSPLQPLAVAIFLLAWTSLAAPVFAQDTAEEFDLYEYAGSTIVTIDIDDVSVNEFVEQIRGQAPALNVMIRSDVEDISLPRLMLRKISADTALRSLQQLSLDAVSVEMDDSQAYYIIGPNLDDPNRLNQTVEVLNVSQFLIDPSTQAISSEKQEQLMSAIEAGREMLATNSGSMKISLHPTTALLFVKGNSEETNLVKRIVGELVPVPVVSPGGGRGAGAGIGAGFGGGAGALGGSEGGLFNDSPGKPEK